MTADEVKQLLQLEPLSIEGGFFRETYRSRWNVSAEYLPDGFAGSRSIGTAIYYMITPETFSVLHRLPGTEVFHFYLGDPVLMLQLLLDGSSRTITLGSDLLQWSAAAGGGQGPCLAGLPIGARGQVGTHGDDHVSGLRLRGL